MLSLQGTLCCWLWDKMFYLCIGTQGLSLATMESQKRAVVRARQAGCGELGLLPPILSAFPLNLSVPEPCSCLILVPSESSNFILFYFSEAG
jgi:hypothetical protein